ncbi:hypothetical protein ABXJ76_11385 [Methylobacter sp. G7]|uniref:hypothetical protein n=1 Tax=Methylobacter sp. G7 TaxID=3230117 RepID=UPI003D80147B
MCLFNSAIDAATMYRLLTLFGFYFLSSQADNDYGKRVADQSDIHFEDVKQRAESYKE